MQTGDEPGYAMFKRYGLYSLLTFAGFWGNFGWLQRPLSLWVYAVLAVICLLAAAGECFGFFVAHQSSHPTFLVVYFKCGCWL